MPGAKVRDACVRVLRGTDRIRTFKSMSATVPKQARLDLRLPQEARELIDEAASLAGVSLTDYVLGLVIPAARRDVVESHTIRLSRRAWDDFCDMLDRPDNDRLAALRAHTPEWDVERR